MMVGVLPQLGQTDGAVHQCVALPSRYLCFWAQNDSNHDAQDIPIIRNNILKAALNRISPGVIPVQACCVGVTGCSMHMPA